MAEWLGWLDMIPRLNITTLGIASDADVFICVDSLVVSREADTRPNNPLATPRDVLPTAVRPG